MTRRTNSPGGLANRWPLPAAAPRRPDVGDGLVRR
jgi:hypothetical protein